MRVQVKYKEEGDLLCEYDIHLRNLNGPVTEQEYFDAAWDCVVEDELLYISYRDDFDFELIC